LAWEINGRRQHIITSSTQSDWRSTLNARARIRRMLRAAGVYNQEQPSKLVTAMQVPEFGEPLGERINRLEADVSTLLDMLVDAIIAQRQVLAQRRAPATKVVTAKKHQTWVLQYLHFDTWAHRSQVKDVSGRSQGSVDMALCLAKKRGLAENQKGGLWRKTIQGSL
jgi:hypothetical protein